MPQVRKGPHAVYLQEVFLARDSVSIDYPTGHLPSLPVTAVLPSRVRVLFVNGVSKTRVNKKKGIKEKRHQASRAVDVPAPAGHRSRIG